MELKKSPKADLENKRRIFLQVGLVLSLAIVLLAFEWKNYERKESGLENLDVVFVEEEDIPVTRQETNPTPPPPEPSTELNIVEDDVEVEEEFVIDVEATATTAVKEYVPIVVEKEEEIAEEVIFTVVEENPGYPGGEEARMKYLQQNLKYPQMARESGIQGTVYVTFVVEKDGSITDVRILRGIGGGCDEEAARVVKAMPRWNPGKQRGQAVRVQFNLPIRFVLT
ncbi:MAG: energy transducer TonB [Bacteroidales bacterium]|nr:energy transducer TonB [Bacteroidales bacterium]